MRVHAQSNTSLLVLGQSFFQAHNRVAPRVSPHLSYRVVGDVRAEGAGMRPAEAAVYSGSEAASVRVFPEARSSTMILPFSNRTSSTRLMPSGLFT